jgi:hypothetical protein
MKQLTWLFVCSLLVLFLFMAACGSNTSTSTVTSTLPSTTQPVETPSSTLTTSVPGPEQTTAPAFGYYNLTASVFPPLSGAVSVSSGPYKKDSMVYITATPYVGFKFDKWTGNASGSNSTITIVMDSDKNVVANFADIVPPVISNITLDITDITTTIKWDTNEPATSQIDYGTTSNYGFITPMDNQFTANHSVTISGLMPDTVYQYRIKSIDLSGNLALSGSEIFNTKTLGQVVTSNISRSSNGVTYTLVNRSSQTIRLLRAELVDKDGIIRHADESTEVGIPYITYIVSGSSLTKTYTTPGQTYGGWRVIWYCKDVNLVPFTVTSNSISP